MPPQSSSAPSEIFLRSAVRIMPSAPPITAEKTVPEKRSAITLNPASASASTKT